jgi:hypothetical protein
MTSAISASTAAYYNSLALASSGTDWIASTVTAIKNSASSAGILGALAGPNDGSVSSFLSQSSSFAGNFATIAQSNVSNSGSFYAQIAAANQQAAAQKKLQDAFNAMSASQQTVQPKNVLDPIIYLGDGVTLDTDNNILTLSNGDQIDSITGVKIIDPSTTIAMANGAYLDTKNNILTMSDGTQIDTVTGLKISKTA